MRIIDEAQQLTSAGTNTLVNHAAILLLMEPNKYGMLCTIITGLHIDSSVHVCKLLILSHTRYSNKRLCTFALKLIILN